jgi:Acyl-CoA carboxylase epsilon subunit
MVPDDGPVMTAGTTDETGGPFLRVVKGDPTPEELAALVTVLASLGGPTTAPARRTPDWSAPRRLHRVVHPHGPGGWRASGLPR